MVADTPGHLNLKVPPPVGFDMQELIGKGTYGEVYRAKDIITGEIVALKKICIDDESEGFPITAIREIQILKRLCHENIIRLREVVTSTGEQGEDNQQQPGKNKDKGGVYMVLDYMDHDLAALVQRHGVNFSVPQIKCYMKQLLTGLQYCHDNQVLHRDIKGANILVNNEGNLKLADFGLARSFPTGFAQKHKEVSSDKEPQKQNVASFSELSCDENLSTFEEDQNQKVASCSEFMRDENLSTFEENEKVQTYSKPKDLQFLSNTVVTLWYKSPELLLGAKDYGPEIDIWSVGCVFASILNGQPILQGKNQGDQLKKIFELFGSPEQNNWPGVSEMPLHYDFAPIVRLPTNRCVKETYGHFDPLALDLLEKMLMLDPSQRISVSNALNDAYFTTEPLPCDPKSLPSYESSLELKVKQEAQQKLDEEAAKEDEKSAGTKLEAVKEEE